MRSVTWRVSGEKRTSKSIAVEAAASTTQEHRQVEPAASCSWSEDTTRGAVVGQTIVL
jgi:hypothetical protein